MFEINCIHRFLLLLPNLLVSLENIDALKKANEGENLEAIKKGIEELTNSSMKLGEAIYKQQQAQGGAAGAQPQPEATAENPNDSNSSGSNSGDDDVVDADYTEKK